VAVVDFDLPAVEINLQELFGGSLQVSGQQVSRLAVVESTAFTFAIGGGSDDQQAERDASCTPAPVHLGHFFVADLAPLAPVEQLGLFPGPGLILAHLFGGERLGVVEAARIVGSAKG